MDHVLSCVLMSTNKFNISITEIQNIAEAKQSILNNNEINERKKKTIQHCYIKIVV